MNSNALVFFTIVQLYLTVASKGQICDQGPTVTAMCNETKETSQCMSPWRIHRGEHCYLFKGPKNYKNAENFCRTYKGRLLRLRKDSATDMRLGRDILKTYKKTSFWLSAGLRVSSPNLSGDCPVFVKDKVEPVKCTKAADVVCEKPLVVELSLEKPTLHIRARGDLPSRQLYESAPVRVTCSVIRAKRQDMHIRLTNDQDQHVTRSGQDLEVITEDTDCGVKTIGKTTFDHSEGRSISLACFLESPSSLGCSEHSNACVKSKQFDLIGKPTAPHIKVSVSESPNIIHESSSLRANCSAHLNLGCDFAWAVSVDNKTYILDDFDTRVKTEEVYLGKGESYSMLQLVLENKGWGYKNLRLTCFSFQDESRCEEGDFWCSSVTLHVKPSPKMRIYYHRPPDVMYKGHTLEARCLLHVRYGERIIWASFNKYQTSSAGELITPSSDTMDERDDTDIVRIKEVAQKDDYSISILHIQNISAINNDMSIACVSSNSFVPSKTWCMQNTVKCVLSVSLKVIDGPEPPDMSVFFSSPPSNVLVGNDLTAECNAVIGEGGTLMWVLYINSSFITDDDQSLNITMSQSVNTLKNSFTRQLKITDVTHTLNGLVIACFSYDIRLFPERRMRCQQEDPLCNATLPLRLKNKVLKYVLVWLAWLSLVVVVHLYIWYGPCVCYPSDAGPPAYDDYDFGDFKLRERKR